VAGAGRETADDRRGRAPFKRARLLSILEGIALDLAFLAIEWLQGLKPLGS
jgi:hypothetical protein